MIIKFIICMLAVLVVALIVNAAEDIKKFKKRMSFKESLDLTDIPIVTFLVNGVKLNFLLDTGSSNSHINKSVLINSDLNYKNVDASTDVMGIDGKKISVDFCKLALEYKEQVFDAEFSILDLDDAFRVVKEESGVQMHGILGSDFFQKYRYILDFNDFVAYPK